MIMNYLIICIPQEITSASGKTMYIGTPSGEVARSIDDYSLNETDKFDYDYNDIDSISTNVVKILLNISKQQEIRRTETARITNASLDNLNDVDGQQRKPETVVKQTPDVGRNEPCPCGSGKKYKNCCGK